MRILSLAAGAGGMYCGSCLRDNAVAAELIARGHDVTLLPLYTPLLTDEPNVSRHEVLFGGINIYLQQKSPVFRHLPRFLDRLLDRPRVIRAFASRPGTVDAALLGDLTIAMLDGADGVLRKEFAKLTEWISGEPRPDVVNITNSLLIGLARPLREALGRPVCVTLQGEDLFLRNLVEPYRTRALELIRAQVGHVDRFVAVSDFYAGFMRSHLQIPAEKVAIVPLGINLAEYDAGPAKRESRAQVKDRFVAPPRGERNAPDGVFTVGYLARVAPEKGLHALAAAFVRLKQRTGSARVRLEAAGYLAPADRKYLDRVRRSLERAGLSNDFTYHGALDRREKLAFLQTLEVLSMPATYDEPKGFPLLEAMAAGVPVVQPRRGSFTEIVERTGGGILVDPDDVDGLADGLFALFQNRERREELGRRGRDGVRLHYSIQKSADRLLAVYGELAAAGAHTASLHAQRR
jgi:glycosyltransferase involved in cell wall biosynthesis